MSFDLKTFLSELTPLAGEPEATTQETTSTGRVYTSIAVVAGGTAELKFNSAIEPYRVPIMGPDGQCNGVANLATLCLRFAQHQGIGCPNFDLPKRATQPEQDQLYRYDQLRIPVCYWGPLNYLKLRWEQQNSSAQVAELVIAQVLKAGGQMLLNTQQLEAVINQWLASTTFDPDMLSLSMKGWKAKTENDD